MKKTVHQALWGGIAFCIAASPVVMAQPGKLSWFDDKPFAGAGAVGVPEIHLHNPDLTSFGLNLYSSRELAQETSSMDAADSLSGADSVHLYGELESNRKPAVSFENNASLNRVNNFGVKWRHNVNAAHSFAFSAEYGEGTAVYPAPLDTLDTRAAFSWTSRLASGWKPSLTGSVFIGDEMAREEIYRRLGRRYYGFTVGGSMTVFQSHTPYVSFKMQKSLYDTTDELMFISPRSDDRSLFSAGWKWQVQRDLSLQAEASYGLSNANTNPQNLDPYNLQRSRIFFGTRFDFK
ncbi:MAG: hypothetical protein HY081_00335 [Gammaproteobacteria bacterium]|nr:hypothetical protein [Gammaproteobacteria bacterium]